MSPVLLAGLVAGLALVLTAVLTPVVRGAAMGGGMVRQVQEDRWHKRPTPAIGGVAIFLGFGLAVGGGYLLSPDATYGLGTPSPRSLLPWTTWEGLLVGSTLAFLVGLVDDFIVMDPLPKLFGQLLAASILLLSGIGVWLTGIYAVDAALSLLWFVGLTNAVNLLDNMDGLAAGVSLIAGVYLAVLFALEGTPGLAVLALAFSAALLGFLAHNYPPARIFMGDSGSLFIGLFLAGLALAPAEGLSRSLAGVLAAPVLILGVPILDTALVTVGRLLEGRPVSQGGKDHTSHRFVHLGMTEKRTVWLLWGLAALGGAVGLALRSTQRSTALLMGGILVGMLAVVGAYLLAVRLRSLEEVDTREMTLYRFLVRGQESYPVAAVFIDAVWIGLAYYAAYLVRWEPSDLPSELPYFERTIVFWVGIKVVALMLSGTYASRWQTFGLYDALRILRSNVVASLLAAGFLLVVQRVGLSRGVVAIDFLVCSILTIGARFSFRLIEGTTQRWSEEGIPVVLLATAEEAEFAARWLRRLGEPSLRPVAVADPEVRAARAQLGGLPLYGGQAGLRHALEAARASAVVLVEGAGSAGVHEAALTHHLELEGAVDVYRLDVTVRREG